MFLPKESCVVGITLLVYGIQDIQEFRFNAHHHHVIHQSNDDVITQSKKKKKTKVTTQKKSEKKSCDGKNSEQLLGMKLRRR